MCNQIGKMGLMQNIINTQEINIKTKEETIRNL